MATRPSPTIVAPEKTPMPLSCFCNGLTTIFRYLNGIDDQAEMAIVGLQYDDVDVGTSQERSRADSTFTRD
jgi:hypothetical protein